MLEKNMEMESSGPRKIKVKKSKMPINLVKKESKVIGRNHAAMVGIGSVIIQTRLRKKGWMSSDQDLKSKEEIGNGVGMLDQILFN